jgi:hypothetical protein
MKTEIRDQGSGIGSSGSGEFEMTLRMIARLSVPDGLEDRVQAGLRTVSPKARILRWPEALRLDTTWMQNQAWMQNLARVAAAAAIAALVIGGSWSISSRFQPSQPTSAVATPLRGASQGGFSSAGAMRTPQTLNGPIVTHPALTATQKAKPSAKHAAKSSVRQVKIVPAKNPIAPNPH